MSHAPAVRQRLGTHFRSIPFRPAGLSLGYYRGYNVTWNDPSNYFDPRSDLKQTSGRVRIGESRR